MNVDGVVLSAIGEVLVRAAAIVEDSGNMHPFRAISIAAPNADLHHRAVVRLANVSGIDFMDHDAEENIGDLVAAAFWDAEVVS